MTWEGHTAGTPESLTTEVIWSSDQKTATFSIEGWENPNGHVRIFMAKDFFDTHGNLIPAGTTLWDYALVGAPPTYTISGRASGGSFGGAAMEGMSQGDYFGIYASNPVTVPPDRTGINISMTEFMLLGAKSHALKIKMGPAH